MVQNVSSYSMYGYYSTVVVCTTVYMKHSLNVCMYVSKFKESRNEQGALINKSDSIIGREKNTEKK